MSVYKRKSGRYAVLIDLESGPAGGRRRSSLGTFATRKEAERAEREALGARDRGIDLDPRKVTLAAVAERFLKAVGPDLSPATLARYEEHWRMHLAPTLGGIVITNLKPAHLAELYGKLRSEPIRYVRQVRIADGSFSEKVSYGRPLGPNTVLRIHRLTHRLLGWAERMSLVARNVARSIEAPKASPSPARALTADQVASLLAASEGTRLHPFVVLAVTTGMRRGEIGALSWDTVDLERRTLTVRQAIGDDRKGTTFLKTTKSGRERALPLSPLAAEALRRLKVSQAADKLAAPEGAYQDRGFVFADELGRLLDLDSVSKAFSALASRLGIKSKGISLHSCRHFGATQALVSGNDVRTVAALLGHASASTTLNVYGHVVAGAQERAVTGIGDAIAAAQARHAAAEN